MEALLSLIVGVLMACGVYMLLRRSIVKLLMGFILLGSGGCLLIFVAGGVVRARAPIALPGQAAPHPPYADPLSQALILTAIVISFGVLAFAMILLRRQHDLMDTDDLDTLDSPSTVKEGEQE